MTANIPFGIGYQSPWMRASGPILTLGLIGTLVLTNQSGIVIPNPPAFLVLVIVYSAFAGGLIPGLISAVLSWFYIFFFFATPGPFFHHTDENFRRVVVWAITMPATAILVGMLKNFAERSYLRQDKLEQFFKFAPDAIVIVDSKGCIAHVNDQAENVFGYHSDELIGHPVEMLIPAHLSERHRQHRAGYMNHPHVRPMGSGLELSGRRKDGGVFPADITLGPLHTREGLFVLSVVRDITELKKAELEINQFNANLERRVQERTAELQAANRELESFSYAVSHDLRAPLRAIDGFSKAVIEDYAGQLDEKGKDYLNRVRAAAHRMGELIDDLLALSRVTRAEMQRTPVNLSRLATGILSEFQKNEPDRKVNWEIEPDMSVVGDEHLLRVLLDNLLGNAWKFTGKSASALIEFGSMRKSNGNNVFFVRDNGAGFDMTYAGKLFGAFQRLHTAAEFPGTGIGLATVQRIIHRHGGDIRAHGLPGKGAEFIFSLPD